MRPLFLLLLLGLASDLRADEMRAGASAVKITPPDGTPMAGYYVARAAEGVHDDLYAKALVIQGTDGTKAALVALDLISTTRDLVEKARAEVEKATGIPGAHVMISATHAHTGPILADRGPRDDALGATQPLARAYSESLPGKIAEAVRVANESLAPANLFEAAGQESSIAFNRRFHMADGSVGWNPGKLNPKILKAAGTIDPEVPLVYAEAKADRRPIALYANYAVHLDNVGGRQISADMPGVLAELMDKFQGPRFVTVWTAGCCGDINHIDVKWAERQSGHENAARMGIILAGEVLRTWPKFRPIEPGPVRVLSETVLLPLPKLAEDAESKAREAITKSGGQSGGAVGFLDLVDAYKVLDVLARAGKPQQVEVQVVALGDRVAWVSLPGEIFVELGLSIKQDSPFPRTIVAELANGAIGYIPSRRAYAQGNYEVVSARCAEGSGERLVDAAVRMLKRLHGEARTDRAESPNRTSP